MNGYALGMSESAMFAIALSRGTVLHLVREGEPLTLCGRNHRVNVRYINERGPTTLPAAAATCGKCAKVQEVATRAG